MLIIHTITELRAWRQQNKRVALVPTMGNLHEGHLSLVRAAKAHADAVVVSIFVNRIQFGIGEDFDQYPRTLEQDIEKLIAEGADVVFVPAENELYPNGIQRYFVEPPAIQNELCGRSRPGHFRGVATVVTKLFNIVQPDVACFGKKDYQQLAVIKGMVQDLNMNIEIIPVEIERAKTGLALSSRNGYLTDKERVQAAQLSARLQAIAKAIAEGNKDFAALENSAVTYLQQHGWQVDYIEVRQAQTLTKAQITDNDLVIVAAAVLGTTRLIDNIEVHLSHSK
ncbi:pantoate--beta-alanine ligase [Snodgrassella alvi]|jgi:pantoate--beta-alanine ligase|uniref:Pantothenate synthetase n=1 Tax=Snodgrassella alvi TaxID=1196083 RepID=A0A855FLM0_9NEIS|nr:pantoate--beta-alanine ligase [Snodgrassella alvi]PIT14726.1 pantoate--beta-alanine ligase [Snodgrassella alvi]PIT57615.1 pantoate--beta-alanine ligase [Snodgrassella alvi]PIT59919.1 pantoate--beta-alanine ligase [Snodgrassella alvi]